MQRTLQHTRFGKHLLFSDLVLIDIAFAQSSIKSYASYSLLKNSSIEISSIGLLEQCSVLHYLIIFFFSWSGMIFLDFLADTDLRTDFLAVWRPWYILARISINCLHSSVWALVDIGAKLLQLLGTMPTIIQQWQKFLGVNNFYIPTVGIMDFTNMNMNTGFFSWIISADISVLLKIYGYEYEYAKFSWILSMGSPSEKRIID